MTEKEFIERIQDNFTTNNAAILALQFAKQHGAKFDPEPENLSNLQFVLRSFTHGYGYLIITEKGHCPNQEQAIEIVRRCKIIPQLRKYISTWFITPTPNNHVQTVLDIIDGKERTV